MENFILILYPGLYDWKKFSTCFKNIFFKNQNNYIIYVEQSERRFFVMLVFSVLFLCCFFLLRKLSDCGILCVFGGYRNDTLQFYIQWLCRVRVRVKFSSPTYSVFLCEISACYCKSVLSGVVQKSIPNVRKPYKAKCTTLPKSRNALILKFDMIILYPR